MYDNLAEFHEIFFTGGTPYGPIRNKDLVPRVERGMRLNQTPYMSDDIYQLMLSCWEVDPDERPNFLEIEGTLSQLAQYGVVSFFRFEIGC